MGAGRRTFLALAVAVLSAQCASASAAIPIQGQAAAYTANGATVVPSGTPIGAYAVNAKPGVPYQLVSSAAPPTDPFGPTDVTLVNPGYAVANSSGGIAVTTGKLTGPPGSSRYVFFLSEGTATLGNVLRIAGSPQAISCAPEGIRVQLRGSQIRRIRAFLDGKPGGIDKRPDRHGRFTVLLRAPLSSGEHHVKVRVKFANGKKRGLKKTITC
jgi:hypothetical protein